MKIKIQNEKRCIDLGKMKGTKLMDVCEEYNVKSIKFGCGEAACGSCLIRVVENPENLSPIGYEERVTLDSLNAHAEDRLACQVYLNGDVTIERVI